jgi:hypothetical protein
MKNIHTLNLALYNKYGENWINDISFYDNNIRQALRLIYPNDFSQKSAIIQQKKERGELLRGIARHLKNK